MWHRPGQRNGKSISRHQGLPDLKVVNPCAVSRQLPLSPPRPWPVKLTQTVPESRWKSVLPALSTIWFPSLCLATAYLGDMGLPLSSKAQKLIGPLWKESMKNKTKCTHYKFPLIIVSFLLFHLIPNRGKDGLSWWKSTWALVQNSWVSLQFVV